MYQNCYVTFIGTCSSQVRWIRQSMRSCQHVKLHSQYVTFLVSSVRMSGKSGTFVGLRRLQRNLFTLKTQMSERYYTASKFQL